MRVLHLQGADDRRVDLHARITVLRGDDAAERARLVAALAALVGTAPSSVEGLVEVRGIHLDLGEATRNLLRLDERGDVRIVVAAADLPGYDDELLDARRHRDDARGRRDAAAVQSEDHRAGLADAVARRDDVQAELAEIERGEGAARALLAAAGAERSRLEFELEVARDDRARLEARLSEALLARDALRNEHDKGRLRLRSTRTRRQQTMRAAAAAAGSLEDLRSIPPPDGDDVEATLDVTRERSIMPRAGRPRTRSPGRRVPVGPPARRAAHPLDRPGHARSPSATPGPATGSPMRSTR